MDKKLNSNTFKKVILNFMYTMAKLELEKEVCSRTIWQELDLFYLDYIASYVERTPDDQI